MGSSDDLTLHPIVVRQYRPDDEIEIVRMIRDTLDWPGFEHRGEELDYWRWKYRGNTVGAPSEAIAEAGGTVLSHASSMPTLLRVGGSIVRAAQLSDLYTHPDHRGQGLVDQALASVEQQDREKGIEFQFAFPSAVGYELTMKRGFVEMPVRMGQYEMIVNPQRFFSKVPMGTVKRVAHGSLMLLKGRIRTGSTDADVDVVDSFPDDVGEMVERFEERFGFVFHRTLEYLQWRYADQDGGAFKILIASREGASRGYLVLRPYHINEQGYMDIVDLVTLPDDTSSLRSLINAALELCRQSDVDVIQMWLPTAHPYLPELGRMGFFLRQPTDGERWMTMVGRPLNNEVGSRIMDGGLSYHLVLGDTDWV